ncbi:ketopantoate reductase [Neorhizobium sp. R1-B]|uniref:ketopantoate reductase family protein n=1 Tax=unclassified Neorhizobium TaxID=2629175 RepID=UPI001052BD5E|nr:MULTISPECIES: 2-dehydropantoate 2-reductase [unclassified Neorhizobium]TCV62915.1 ketopantoate reductase [Neorhizobium sp. S3-V5DH]TDX73521.1 ketopantoate reductase [Neorhizobium sp. R1-B]
MAIRNICIYGAGALGGAFAAKLANTLGDEVNVSVIARGAHLAAIQENGLTVVKTGEGGSLNVRLAATSDPKELPKQDLVITGMKGHQLADAAEGLASLLKDGTRIVPVVNGIPWWYFHRDEESGHAERQLPELDPDGKLWRLVGPERVIGCVAYQGGEVVEPGMVRLYGDGRFFLGEPSGELSQDLVSVSELLGRAGITIVPTQRIRDAIWTKLMGNAAYNPISALTRARMDRMMENRLLVEQISKVMTETRAVGEALGAVFNGSVDEQLNRSGGFGPVKTSMLQDLIAGKPLEIGPLTGMVVALGKLTGVATPTCETVLALTTQLDHENLRD